jgi:hypothetical protein
LSAYNDGKGLEGCFSYIGNPKKLKKIKDKNIGNFIVCFFHFLYGFKSVFSLDFCFFL